MMSKNVFVDCRCCDDSLESLYDMGYNPVLVPMAPYLDGPVCAHPDMHMVKIKDKWFVSNVVHKLLKFFRNYEICEREVQDGILRYPDDVYLNCAVIGNKILCNENFTHRKIIEYAESFGFSIVNVKQGYAKCSVCIVDDNSIITEDESIAKSASLAGIDVLKIRKGEVALQGYDYGFIGGCSGLLEKNVLAFNGKVEFHSDYRMIYEFCKERGVDVISLNSNPLYDIGTLIRG